MKIGIDASRANREFKTGTEWYSYYLIKHLVEIDKDNQYVLYLDSELRDDFKRDLSLDNNSHVTVKVLRWPFKFFWTLGRLSLEMIFRRPDILFVPAHAMPLFFPKKSINTIHDIAFTRNKCLYEKDVVSFESGVLKKITQFFVKIFTRGKCRLRSSEYLDWSTKFSLNKTKKIITVSKFTKEEILRNYRVNADKIKVVHNGFNDKLYTKINDQEKVKEVLRDYGLNDPYFLYVGRIEKKKNITSLINAFMLYKERNKSLPDKLVLVGKIAYGYDEIKYLISEFDLFKDIIMPGWVKEEDLPYIFNGAKAFIFPSLYEGFGIPILQAMASGVPVLASDLKVLQEVGGEAPLFFDPHNASDLCQKMELINSSSQQREEMIIKGFSWVQNFSWKKCAQETLQEIKTL